MVNYLKSMGDAIKGVLEKINAINIPVIKKRKEAKRK